MMLLLFMNYHNFELNDMRKMICLRKSEVSVKRFQFALSLKTSHRMAYIVCHINILPKYFIPVLFPGKE